MWLCWSMPPTLFSASVLCNDRRTSMLSCALRSKYLWLQIYIYIYIFVYIFTTDWQGPRVRLASAARGTTILFNTGRSGLHCACTGVTSSSSGLRPLLVLLRILSSSGILLPSHIPDHNAVPASQNSCPAASPTSERLDTARLVCQRPIRVVQTLIHFHNLFSRKKMYDVFC